MGFAGFQVGLGTATAAFGAGAAMGGHWPEGTAPEELLADPEPRPAELTLPA